MHIVRQTVNLTATRIGRIARLDDAVVITRPLENRHQIDKTHIVRWAAKKGPGATYLDLDQVGHVEIGPKRGAQPTVNRIAMHQLHVQLCAGVLRLKRGHGLLIRHRVIAGKGPKTQRRRRLFYGMKYEICAGEQSNNQNERGRLAKRQPIRKRTIRHAQSLGEEEAKTIILDNCK